MKKLFLWYPGLRVASGSEVSFCNFKADFKE